MGFVTKARYELQRLRADSVDHYMCIGGEQDIAAVFERV